MFSVSIPVRLGLTRRRMTAVEIPSKSASVVVFRLPLVSVASTLMFSTSVPNLSWAKASVGTLQLVLRVQLMLVALQTGTLSRERLLTQ